MKDYCSGYAIYKTSLVFYSGVFAYRGLYLTLELIVSKLRKKDGLRIELTFSILLDFAWH